MRTSGNWARWNLAVQIVAAVVTLAARVTSPGVLFAIFFVLFPVVTGGLVAQMVMAAHGVRRGRLPAAVLVPSFLTAVCALGAALLITDGSDRPNSEHRPFDVLFGTHLGGWADSVGHLLAMGWFVALLATVSAMAATRPPRPAPPYPPYAMHQLPPAPRR